MIRIVQGNPGSGKSYYAANYIAEKCCTYDPLYKSFTLLPNTVIITNIVDLRVSHLNFDDLITKYTIEKFLTVANFEILIEKYRAQHVVLIIDEAQKYLDSKFYDKDVFYFFQYHRHLGLDIFLLTQSVTTVCRQLIPLCEFIVEACPRSKGLAGTMRYKFKDTKGMFMYSKAIRKKQETFDMYSSFTTEEAEKPKNVLTHWILVLSVVLVVVVVGFKGFFYSYSHKSATTRVINPSGTVLNKPVQAVLSSPRVSAAVLKPTVLPAAPPRSSPRPVPNVDKRPILSKKQIDIPMPVAELKTGKSFYYWHDDAGQLVVSNNKSDLPYGVPFQSNTLN